MAHQSMRCNLASAIFPFATMLWGRSIIVPQYDQNFDRTVNSAADVDKDKGVPQAFYMHNVMPTSQGYMSIGYDTAVPALVGATDFDAVFPIQDISLARFLFCPAVGKNYVFDKDVGIWASISPYPSGTFRDDVLVTTAFLEGQSYIFYANTACLTYNPTTKLMNNITLSGLVLGNIKGICAAIGYMIAWTDTDIAWSSQTTVTDFNPSLVTGAGGGTVAEAKGKIIVALPISGGFLLYCEKNIVAAKYSGNARFPFIFSEVTGSGGLISPEQVSWQANLSQHYAWTTVGFQQVDKNTAQNIFPEVTDFLAAKFFEDLDDITLLLTETFLSQPLNIKVTAVSDRFMVISYGVSSTLYTHAIVFDLSLKRYGKLKIQHRDCFQWNAPNIYGALTYGGWVGSYGDYIGNITYGDLGTLVNTPEVVKKTFAFLQTDGTVKIVNFDLAQTNASGVLLIGKFQFQRNKRIVHQKCDVESVIQGLAFNYYIVTTNDGKTLLPPVAGFLALNNPKSKRYMKMVDGLNFTSMFVGAFDLTSIIVDFTVGGDT